MTPLVEIQNLVKHFDLGGDQRVHAVDDVSLSIRPREIVGLVGESGSGKSTLGKTILGLHDKTGGSVAFAGQMLPRRYRASDFRAMAPKMQMIFQDPQDSLNPRMTVGDIIGEPIIEHQFHKGKERREKIEQLNNEIKDYKKYIEEITKKLDEYEKN